MSTTNVDRYQVGSRWLFYPRYERGTAGYEVVILGPPDPTLYDYRVLVVKIITKNEHKSRHGLREAIEVDHCELIPLIRTVEEIEAYLAS